MENAATAKQVACNTDQPDCLPGQRPNDNFWPRLWLRVGISLVLAGQGMVFGLGLNTADPPLTPSSPIYWVLHAGLLLSALIPMGLLAGPLFRESWSSIRSKSITVELLFTLSLVGALVGSVTSSVRGYGSVYYEVVAVVLVIYTVGKAIGVRSKSRAQQEARKLEQALDFAMIESPSGLQCVPLESLSPEHVVVVGPGEVIPVDGTVLRGASYVQEQPLTGEPAPVERKASASVLAGTHPIDGTLFIRPEKLKGHRRYDQVLEAVQSAREKPTHLQSEVDKLTRWFVPLVAGVSFLTFLGWLPFVDWMTALFNAMAVLIVACPCAMGLATPTAVWTGLASLAKLGLIAWQGDILEVLSRAKAFVFDKTGTLSHEAMQVASVECYHEFESDLKTLAGGILAIEASQSHPVAYALSDWAREQGAEASVVVDSIHVVPAQGIQADLRNEGATQSWYIGSAGFALDEAQTSRPNEIFVSISRRPVAKFTLMESLRPDVKTAIASLKKSGFQVSILSGDPTPAFKELGGVAIESGLTPVDKVTRLKQFEHPLVFVGDGLNDAPALAEADAAIALDHGADLSKATADAVLLGGNLNALPAAVGFSKKLIRAVHSNLRFALVYNILGMGLAAGGILHPVVAALLMLGSSAIVSGRVLRVSTIKD